LLLFGIVLAFAGLASVLLVAWHFLLRLAALVPMLDFRPQLPPQALIDPYLSLPVFDILAKLNDVQFGLAYAIFGAFITVLGVALARREMNLLRTGKRWREDALRRVHQYRESSQAQAVVASDVRIGKDADWISPAHDRGTAPQEGIRQIG
jgi:hypothetical protein